MIRWFCFPERVCLKNEIKRRAGMICSPSRPRPKRSPTNIQRREGRWTRTLDIKKRRHEQNRAERQDRVHTWTLEVSLNQSMQEIQRRELKRREEREDGEMSHLDTHS